MSETAQPHLQTDLAYILPADAYYHLIRSLVLTLPPPPTGTPEDLTRRDHAAIARIAALQPANSAEAELAAQFVAASEQWKECLRLAQDPATVPEAAMKCRAQAGSMMRQAQSAMRVLLRVQAARGRLEANNEAYDRAERAEHVTASLMAQALADLPVHHPTNTPTRVSLPDTESTESQTETPARFPAPQLPNLIRVRLDLPGNHRGGDSADRRTTQAPIILPPIPRHDPPLQPRLDPAPPLI